MAAYREAVKKLKAASVSQLVLQLCKSHFGLKQAGRLWIQLLHARLLESDFKRCASDMFLYWRKDGSDLVVVGVHADDLLATGTNTEAFDSFFTSLRSLSVKNLGAVSKFLGMRVAVHDDGSYVADQEGAIGDLLREHGLEDANSTRTHIGSDCYEVPSGTAHC